MNAGFDASSRDHPFAKEIDAVSDGALRRAEYPTQRTGTEPACASARLGAIINTSTGDNNEFNRFRRTRHN
jgi:hypothetical protein